MDKISYNQRIMRVAKVLNDNGINYSIAGYSFLGECLTLVGPGFRVYFDDGDQAVLAITGKTKAGKILNGLVRSDEFLKIFRVNVNALA